MLPHSPLRTASNSTESASLTPLLKDSASLAPGDLVLSLVSPSCVGPLSGSSRMAVPTDLDSSEPLKTQADVWSIRVEPRGMPS